MKAGARTPPSPAPSLLPNNIYASACSPDKVMDSRGDFACAWK